MKYAGNVDDASRGDMPKGIEEEATRHELDEATKSRSFSRYIVGNRSVQRRSRGVPPTTCRPSQPAAPPTPLISQEVCKERLRNAYANSI